MHGKPAEISALLFAPDREICLRAISLALLKVRALDGMTCKKLGKLLDCCPDSIAAATNEHNLMAFDSLALLCHYFPDESAPIRAVLFGADSAPLTPLDRLDRIEREAEAIRKELAA